MTTSRVELAVSISCQLGECPRWHAASTQLYWLDIEAHRLHGWQPNQDQLQTHTFDELVSSFGFRSDGGFVLTTSNDFLLADASWQTQQRITTPEAARPASRFNDGAVDPSGNYWAGTLSKPFTQDNPLYCLRVGTKVEQQASTFVVGNGLGWSPDGEILYFVDTRQQCIFRYGFADGSITTPLNPIHIPTAWGYPDGIAIDGSGGIWCALWDGWAVVRLGSDGELIEHIPLPVQRPTSCAFGGDDMKTLFVTSACTGLSASQLNEQPDAGSIFSIQTDIEGMASFAFAA